MIVLSRFIKEIEREMKIMMIEFHNCGIFHS